jgi:F-type H+-transporting ATPase subunit b
MGELLTKLGIDGKLLLSQAANFLILIWLLRKFAYKPLLKVMKERRAKIEEGLLKAEEAETRLHEANETAKGKIKEAEGEAVAILRSTEEKAKKVEADLLVEARKKETDVLANAERVASTKAEEAAAKVRAEAAGLIRAALVKAIGIKPEAVDEALVARAVEEMKAAK